MLSKTWRAARGSWMLAVEFQRLSDMTILTPDAVGELAEQVPCNEMGIVRNFLNRIHWPPGYAGCVEFRAPCGVGIRASRMLASRYLLAAERTLP